MLFAGRFGAAIVNGTARDMLYRGMSKSSLKLRNLGKYIFDGVLYDGKQNSDNPTPNNIVHDFALPANGSYAYLGPGISWFEKHVNYLRMQECRLQYRVPANWLKSATHNLLSAASVWISANDLFTLTNYSGIDAVGNSNSAALGGTGGVGIDNWGIPTPRSMSVGINLTF